jgi:UDPglucose 6-dehydrogenase
MRITVIGTGYVGLVAGTCLAQVGNDVVCLDVDEGRIAQLSSGIVPIHEPGLDDLVRANFSAGRLRFTTDQKYAITHGQVILVAVGTPAGEDGSADLEHALAAARSIGQHLVDEAVIVNKSTVPVGTAQQVRAAIAMELERRDAAVSFEVVSNPEFLKEGAAVEDFMRPDRIIVGTDNERARSVMRRLYEPFSRNHDKLMFMDERSAELCKYASNAMLATRISFMNELANLADHLGADIEKVRRGMGSDPRIGYDFLYAGCGYGGSCFPKDVRALVHMASECGAQRLGIVEAADRANELQKRSLIDRICKVFGNDLSRRRFALWGLAFKPGTDDMREAPSLVIIQELLRRGARIVAHDPVAMNNARELLDDQPCVTFSESAVGTLNGADALVIVTEWPEYKSPDLDIIRDRLATPVIFDGRNLFDPADMAALGFSYHGIGRGTHRPAAIRGHPLRAA